MKQYILILLLPLCGCIKRVPPPVDYTITLVDRTDSNYCNTSEMPNQVFKHLALSKNVYAGATAIVGSISHYKMNGSKLISIQPTDMLNINEPERMKEIALFKQELSAEIRVLANVEKPMEESEVFHAIFTSLFRLTDQSGNRTLLVYSDLMNHNEFFDAYDNEQMQQLKDHPEEFSEKIDSLYPLANMAQNIEVILYYCPSSKETDEAFYVISNWLKSYLSTKGIRVRIGSEE